MDKSLRHLTFRNFVADQEGISGVHDFANRIVSEWPGNDALLSMMAMADWFEERGNTTIGHYLRPQGSNAWPTPFSIREEMGVWQVRDLIDRQVTIRKTGASWQDVVMAATYHTRNYHITGMVGDLLLASDYASHHPVGRSQSASVRWYLTVSSSNGEDIPRDITRLLVNLLGKFGIEYQPDRV